MATLTHRNKLIRRLLDRIKDLEKEIGAITHVKDAREAEADLKWGIILIRRAVEGLKK